MNDIGKADLEHLKAILDQKSKPLDVLCEAALYLAKVFVRETLKEMKK